MKIIAAAVLTLFAMKGFAQKEMPLYDRPIPNAIKTTNYEKTETTPDGIMIIHKITEPTLRVYQPKPGTSTHTSILIIPGGGYWIVAAKHEGYDLAEQFAARGITAFVLKYRIPSDSTMQNRKDGPLQDAQTAMAYIRSHAKEFAIDPGKIGVMGFSAGGHLAASVGTHYQHPVLQKHTPGLVKPNFMVLVYAVISFTDSIGHLGSRDQLLGKNPPADLVRAYSNELLVDSQTAPTFLVHAKDDDVVPVANSTAFYDALKKENVPAEIYLYEKGGHGFGMNNPTSDVKWLDHVFAWMKTMKWIK